MSKPPVIEKIDVLAAIERLVDYKTRRGFTNLPFISDWSGEYARAYVSHQDADVPGFSVFSRRVGSVPHFYSGEMKAGVQIPVKIRMAHRTPILYR